MVHPQLSFEHEYVNDRLWEIYAEPSDADNLDGVLDSLAEEEAARNNRLTKIEPDYSCDKVSACKRERSLSPLVASSFIGYNTKQGNRLQSTSMRPTPDGANYPQMSISPDNAARNSFSLGKQIKAETKIRVPEFSTTKIRWCDEEDIILTGVHIDVYLHRHSLKPLATELRAAKDQNESCDTLVWKIIAERYELARRRLSGLTGKDLKKRTRRALQKRWKTLVDKTPLEIYVDKPVRSKQLYKLWTDVLNIGEVLTCSEQVFASKVFNNTRN